MGVKVY